MGLLRSTIASTRGQWAIRLITDALALLLVLATYARLGNPDILFHCLWVVLAIQAFLFGLRISLIRIAVATILVVVYASIENAGHPIEPVTLELTEWPLMVMIAIIVAVMADRANRTAHHYAMLYRKASDRLLSAQEEELKRLARDLHDGVGQTLSALALTLHATSGALTSAESAPRGLAATSIRRAQELIEEALDQVRDVSYQLRPERLPETGLAAAIPGLVARSPLRTEVSIEPGLISPALLSPIAEIEVFRIIQEALANAARHSGASQAWIDMSVRHDRLVLEVRDDGIGFDPRNADHGLGLTGMRDRAALLGGSLEISSRLGVGTVVRLGVPRRPPSHGAPTQGAAIASSRARATDSVGTAPVGAPSARRRAMRVAASVAERARRR